MRSPRIAAIAALAVLLLFVLAVAAGHADAATADQDLAQRKGIGGALKTKEKPSKEEGPTKLQMAMGVGSVVVAIIVIKWL